MPPKKDAAAAAASAVPVSGQKRSLSPSPGEGGDSARKARKRHAAPAKGALAEGTAPEEELAEEMALRASFEEFDTALLFAWVSDFNDGSALVPPDKAKNREHILSVLVSHKAQVPRSLEEAQAIFRKHFPDQVVPGPLPSVAAAVDLTDDGDRKSPGNTPTKTPAANQLAATQDEAGDEDDEEEQQLTTATGLDISGEHVRVFTPFSPRKGRSAAGIVPASQAVAHCLTCLTAAPATRAAGGQWVCVCGLRGDLPAGDPANAFLAKHIPGPAAPSVPSGQITSSATSASASSAADSLSRRDRQFAKWAEGPPHPSFAAGSAQKVSFAAALRASRRALLASAVEPPSDQLVALVRSGKLKDVGHAIPRSADRDHSVDDAVHALLLGSDGRLNAAARAAVEAPPLRSMGDLCDALFAVILPSLIDRPAALMEWITVGRSARSLEKSYGWAAAAAYVNQSVAEAVRDEAPLGDINHGVLSTVQMLYPRAAAGPTAPARPAPAGTCHRFNAGEPCVRSPCPFSHACGRCGGMHAAKDCTRQASQRTSIAPGSGRRTRPGASGSEPSVKSASSLSKRSGADAEP